MSEVVSPQGLRSGAGEPSELAPRYRAILDSCEPYLITNGGNLPALDLCPFRVVISPAHRHSPTSPATADLVDLLDRLDGFAFADQDMKMPRWAMFDCGQFPGVVFGFGRRACDLPPSLRVAYGVEDRASARTFVPLSMWIAIRCAEDGAWFGHNLSSANLAAGQDRLPGLGTLTKALGVRLTRCNRQYGATQWDSPSLRIHCSLGAMVLCSAWTPAHSRPDTLVYAIDVEQDDLLAALGAERSREATHGEIEVNPADHDTLRLLDRQIEAGGTLRVVRVTASTDGQRVWLARS